MPHKTVFLSELTLTVQNKCYKSGYTTGDLSKLAKHAKNASRTHAHTNATHGQSPNPHSEPIYTHKQRQEKGTAGTVSAVRLGLAVNA